MSEQGFCTKCGAARAADARFCTSCGEPLSGTAGDGPEPTAAAPQEDSAARPAAGPSATPAVGGPPKAAVAMGALLLVLGGGAAWWTTMSPAPETERAVPGRPQAPGDGGQDASSGLPSGHPSIELPPDVLEFLTGLANEARDNPESVEAAQKLARAQYRASVLNGSYRASAEQALGKLLELDPENMEGLRIAANLAYDGGQYAEAEKRFHAYIEKFPDDASAITDLGSALLFQDRLDDAIKSYEMAIDKDPDFMQAHFNRGIAMQKKGSDEEAAASLHQAFDLAETPDQKQHIENALAEIEKRPPAAIEGARQPARRATVPGQPPSPHGEQHENGEQAPAAQGGMPMPPPAPDRPVDTNAKGDFQKAAEKPVLTHGIVGPRVQSFQWTGETAFQVRLQDFPMDQMPPFAREKFRSGMADKLSAVAAENGVEGPVTLEILDDDSGKVLETIETGGGSEP